MKKYALIFSTILIAIGLMSFGYLNLDQVEEPVPIDFFYNLGPRYNRTFTKAEMKAARTFSEFDNLDALNPKHIVSFKSVKVLTIDDNYDPIKEVEGKSGEFNSVQLQLLASAPYSADILIRADYVMRNNKTGELEDSYSTPHITVVPETRAEYPGGGYDAFVDYVKSHKVEETVAISKDDLKPGKIRFTVSKVGTITKVTLISSSGYRKIDKRMVELITEAPGNWKVAQDTDGQRVEEQLVFSFGIIGC